MELYAQALTANKREAQNQLSAMIAGTAVQAFRGAGASASEQLNATAPELAPEWFLYSF